MVMHKLHQTLHQKLLKTLPVDPEVDMVKSLLERIALLGQQVSSYEENADLLARQFSPDKIKDDNAAIMFYTGFPNYET